jgi:hypothetical protein
MSSQVILAGLIHVLAFMHSYTHSVRASQQKVCIDVFFYNY